MQRTARLAIPHASLSKPHARRSLVSHRPARMTMPRRPSVEDVEAIVRAVVSELPHVYQAQLGELPAIREELKNIGIRLDKVEEQNKEHFPLIKSLHALLSVGEGFGKFLAWTIALAAASATAWTAIKAIFQAKTG